MLVEGLVLMVGLAWEKAFFKASKYLSNPFYEDMSSASRYDLMIVTEVVTAVVVAVVVGPAWAWYIYPKQMVIHEVDKGEGHDDGHHEEGHGKGHGHGDGHEPIVHGALVEAHDGHGGHGPGH